ncbi:hypothetical protein GCM10010464_04240 [Pseudonocardia yunnanensis]
MFHKTAIIVLDHVGLTALAIAGHSGHLRPSITQDVYMGRRADGRQAADALDAAMGSMLPQSCGRLKGGGDREHEPAQGSDQHY